MVSTMIFQQSQNVWILEVYPDFSRGAIKSLEDPLFKLYSFIQELKLWVFWEVDKNVKDFMEQ
jgi:hypothetical protein